MTHVNSEGVRCDAGSPKTMNFGAHPANSTKAAAVAIRSACRCTCRPGLDFGSVPEYRKHGGAYE